MAWQVEKTGQSSSALCKQSESQSSKNSEALPHTTLPTSAPSPIPTVQDSLLSHLPGPLGPLVPTALMERTPINSSLQPISDELALRCSYTNCLSLFNKLPELRQHAYDTCPHVIALTETWLTSDICDSEVSLTGFTLYRADSCRSHVGGAAIFLHNSVQSATVCSDFALVPGYDMVWLTIPLRQSDSLMLGVVYRSPSTSELDNASFISNLEAFNRSHPTSHLLVVGEFSAPKIDWIREVATDNFSCALPELIQQMSWTQHIHFKPRSRISQTTSVLDNVITNQRHY